MLYFGSNLHSNESSLQHNTIYDIVYFDRLVVSERHTYVYMHVNTINAFSIT